MECAGGDLDFSRYNYKPPNNLRFFALAVIIYILAEPKVLQKYSKIWDFK